MTSNDLSKFAGTAQLVALKQRMKALTRTIESDLGKPLNEIVRGKAYILFDCSSSMAEQSKLLQAKSGAIAFASDAISKGYSVGLVTFASEAYKVCEPLINRGKLSALIEEINADGSTNMADAFSIAIEDLQSKYLSRAIVVVTDGMPDDKDATLNIAEKAKHCGIDIIVVGTDEADLSFLKLLASQTDLAVLVARNQFQQGIASAVKLLKSGRP